MALAAGFGGSADERDTAIAADLDGGKRADRSAGRVPSHETAKLLEQAREAVHQHAGREVVCDGKHAVELLEVLSRFELRPAGSPGLKDVERGDHRRGLRVAAEPGSYGASSLQSALRCRSATARRPTM